VATAGAGEEEQLLERFIGEWDTEVVFPAGEPTGSTGRTVFEWMPGRWFVVQRWEVRDPDFPDGVAILGFDAGRRTYLQHYFDSRGVARLYEMGLDNDTWTLSRTAPDFSPLDFSQRLTANFTEGGRTIEGRWEQSDDGSTWKLDFNLTYRNLS
jgi:hypothetical protein